MDTLVLREGKVKWLLILLGSLAFTVGGVWMIRNGNNTGWGVSIFFGLGVVISVITLLPGAAYLKLDKTGLEMCSLFRVTHLNWSDIAEFSVGRAGIKKMILIRFTDEYKHARAHNKVVSMLGKASEGLTGYDGGLPGSYGMKLNELAKLLNRYRETTRTTNLSVN